MEKLSVLEQLCHCTTRIIATDFQDRIHYATGFLYMVPLDAPNMGRIYIITNRHVAENKKEIKFGLSRKDNNDNPIYEPPVYQIYGTQEGIIYHPNSQVDLCAIPITMLINAREQSGTKLFYRYLTKELIPSEEKLKSLEPVEDILLIGYPNGLWDECNNMPIVRKGITASAPYLSYNGRSEFLIDAACFGGSSGSPVIIYDKGTYRNKNDNSVVLGSRLMLIGVLSQGAECGITGEIVKKDEPQKKSPVNAITYVPNNLGYVINSRNIIELEEIIKMK